MGHIQKMTPEQRSKFLAYKFKRAKEERKNDPSYSWPWWNDKMFKDWQIDITTTSTEQAIKRRDELKLIHKKVKIVCGFEKIIQRIKHFTVIYK